MSGGQSPLREAVLAHNARAWDRLASAAVALARPDVIYYFINEYRICR